MTFEIETRAPLVFPVLYFSSVCLLAFFGLSVFYCQCITNSVAYPYIQNSQKEKNANRFSGSSGSSVGTLKSNGHTFTRSPFSDVRSSAEQSRSSRGVSLRRVRLKKREKNYLPSPHFPDLTSRPPYLGNILFPDMWVTFLRQWF